MKTTTRKSLYALCLRTEGCEDLEVRKVYRVLPDKVASKEGYLRIVDESGEDYLYPETLFVLVELPQEARELLAMG